MNQQNQTREPDLAELASFARTSLAHGKPPAVLLAELRGLNAKRAEPFTVETLENLIPDTVDGY